MDQVSNLSFPAQPYSNWWLSGSLFSGSAKQLLNPCLSYKQPQFKSNEKPKIPIQMPGMKELNGPI